MYIKTAYRYNYNNDQPNTIESIYDEESGLSKYYKWDGKGNMTYRYDEQNKTNTKMCWTEDNRMQAYVQMNEGTDKGRAAYYGYNTTGERYVRYIGTTINITQNGITFHRPVLQSPVLYANSLITLNGKGYTKHYFEGDRRVCSKLGGGFTDRTEDDINDRIKPITGDEYDKLFEQQYQGMKETFGRCMETDVEHNLKYDPYKTIMENELGRDEAEPAFYYHGDHLGSSAYLTDEAGAITQTLNYLPYGEDWVDVHNNPHYLSRYKYNGKEKDPESGLHYYGARYYDSDISQWLSIDPMADKYPSLSPYNYCADNPVILVDPDGREIWITGDNGEKTMYCQDMQYKGNDAFTKETIDVLRQLNETRNGKTLLTELVGSDKIITITSNESSESGTCSFIANKNGGTLQMGSKPFLREIAHELFHGYQYLYGKGGRSIFNECEAYLFAIGISLGSNLAGIGEAFFAANNNKSEKGILYENVVSRLMENFDTTDFDTLINLFKTESSKNYTRVYDTYPIRLPNQTESLIEKFYPLW